MFNKIKSLKNLKIIAILLLLLFLVVGATYAYFKAQTGDTANVPTQVTTNTTDSLVFEVGTDISLTADMTNFTEGMDNRVGTTFARATLKANNKTNSASGNYYVYFDVTKNELTYTTDDKKPELLLKITKPNNEEVITGIDGVEYKEVTDGKGNTISGFDITEYEGLLTIADNYEIISAGEEVHNWNIEVILVNLDGDQTANGGKSFAGSLKIQKEEIKLFANEIKKLYSGIQGTNNLYLHDSTLANSAGDNSYRYTGANPNNYVCFGIDEATCDNDHLYRIIGVFGNQVKLIKADFATTEQLGTAEHTSSTFLKSNYPNYKGVLTKIPRYYWSGSKNTSSINNWSNSTLNTNALNKNFINILGEYWVNKISKTNWVVGGNTKVNIANQSAQMVYKNEITNPVEDTTYSAKIGLMYVSDYMYAASPEYWIKEGYNNDSEQDYRIAIENNWMYSGIYDWTISKCSDDASKSFYIHNNGYINTLDVFNVNGYSIRPVFYLNSEVKLTSGEGTPTNPYRIN